MLPEDAAKLVALRPCIESLIIRATSEPSILEERSELDKELEELVRQLCGENAWCGTQAQPRQVPVPYAEYQQRNRAKHHHHYQGGNQGQQNQVSSAGQPEQYQDQRNSGFGRGGFRGGFRGNDRPAYSTDGGGFRGRGNRGNQYGNQNFQRGRGTPYRNNNFGGNSYGAPPNASRVTLRVLKLN